MNLSLFRNNVSVISDINEGDVLTESLLEDSAQIITTWGDTQKSAPIPTLDVDPVRQAAYGRIGLVSIGEQATLPEMLTGATYSPVMQQIMLPLNPRIASDELYELDSMDFIIVLSGAERRIGKNMVRWVKRLQQLHIPLIVLLPFEISAGHEQQRLQAFTQFLGVPVLSVVSEDIAEARRDFVAQAIQTAPAMGLALAAHLPEFRSPLISTVMSGATENSLGKPDENEIEQVQQQLLRQISAAFACNGHKYEKHRVALETLMQMTNHYTNALTQRLPMRSEERRTRFTNALSTLLIGYGVANYFGAEAPSFRKVLLPTIWRLYRASGRALS